MRFRFQTLIYPLIFLVGGLFGFGYDEHAVVPVVFIASGLVGFRLVIQSKRKLLSGFLFGFGYFLNLIDWLRVIGLDAWIALSLICATWWGIGIWFGSKFLDSKLGSLKFATAFMAFELLRDRFPWGGFGWGQFGIVLIDVPILNKTIPYLGQVLLTWLMIFGWIYLSKNISRLKSLLPRFTILTLIVLLVPAFPTAATTEKYISGVQGGVVYHPLGEYGPAGEVLQKHLETTLENETVLRNSELIVWPESAVDIDVTRYSDPDELLKALSTRLRTPLLVNSVSRLKNEKVSNSSYIYLDDTRMFVYAKQRLVPFGEFLPLRSVIEKLTARAAFMPRDFEPGKSKSTVNLNDSALAICFEIADDQIMAFQPASKYLIVQTNNATYQAGNQSNQQLLITRFRAAELGLPTMTVATSGISATIAANGQVIERIEKGERGVLRMQIPVSQTVTPAKTISLYIPWVIWTLAGLFAFQRIKVRV